MVLTDDDFCDWVIKGILLALYVEPPRLGEASYCAVTLGEALVEKNCGLLPIAM